MPGIVSASTLVISAQLNPCLAKAAAQFRLHRMSQPDDERKGQERDERQSPIEPDQDRGRHQNHQHIDDEINQVQREKIANPVAVAADARHQIARALAAEKFQRELLQVRIRSATHVGSDSLAHPNQHPPACPIQSPGHYCGGGESTQAPPEQVVIDQRTELSVRGRAHHPSVYD